MTTIPPTRWELTETHGYANRFARLIAEGQDIDGEARLAASLVPAASRILDAGAGMGRVGAALARWGHTVMAVEKDPTLVADAAARYPDLACIQTDILALEAATLAQRELPVEFDLIVLVGNVMVLAGQDTEVRLLRHLTQFLHPQGRFLVGFHPTDGPCGGRDYSWEEFSTDVAAAGLAVQHRFGSYQLEPAHDRYVVAILARA